MLLLKTFQSRADYSSDCFTSNMSFSYNDESSASAWTRPARHTACPQRLKYIHNIYDGYIPYVDDPKSQPARTAEKNGLGLYNANDHWQTELMSLAQQVQTSLKTTDDNATNRTRSSRLGNINSGRLSRRSTIQERSHQRLTPKRSFSRSAYHPIRLPKSEILSEKPCVVEPTNEQDHGIWLLPMLCHILHIDTIAEVQEWLLNANPTEKRLAMELVGRTMQDMQQHENEFQGDMTMSDLNNLYWPYKYWRRQQLWSTNSLDNSQHRCERATSPLYLSTPAKSAQSSTDRKVSPTFSPNKSETPIQLPRILDTSRSSNRVATSLNRSMSRGRTPLV